jgi:hypothetical protein
VRFALKCLPRSAATRVLVGELLRLPRHPRAVTLGLVSVARELPAILRDRGRIKRKADVLEAMTAVSR